MSRTPTAQKVDAIQSILDPQFKAHGFRKDRRTYRRKSEDGVWQVFNFQATMFTQSGALDTDFTVNLGVFVAEVWDHFFWHRPVPTKPSEPDCCVRTRFADISPVHGDQWWKTDDQEAIAEELSQLFNSYGFPFLDQFGSRQGISEKLPSCPALWGQNGFVAVAVIHAAAGRRAEAAQTLSAAISEVEQKPGPQLVSERKLIDFYLRHAEQLELRDLLLP